MNIDGEFPLEDELRKLQPAALPESLRMRIAEGLEERLTLGDRVLVAWTGMGALAASVIVAVLIWQAVAPKPAMDTPADVALRQRIAVEYETLLAAH